ncbi:hypothetical protein IU427_20325 [Nocardia beijingensis]|uniref:hypothetical protein n=1 Tax=Nocardia beijingensis TaxID=95162 RepID=UPI001893FDC0|nr:hypothetical protein [Nocardia beijingensis]MBF6467513.1 hypothetical protein [Nocardia beijingensis]
MASLPEKLHRIVAAHMREKPDGGIWLGDSNLLELGHPAWSTTTRRDAPRWLAGSTWEDLSGAHDSANRAVLLGRGLRFADCNVGGIDRAVHEFGHAVDHALNRPSQAPAFTEVHARVLPLLEAVNPGAAAYYAQPGRKGKMELFGEGIAWYYRTEQPKASGWFDSTEQPVFLNSVAAGHHLTNYYQRLESALGIAT